MMIDKLYPHDDHRFDSCFIIIIIVILPPYIEIYKVFKLYLAVVFEILRYDESTMFSCSYHFISCFIMMMEEEPTCLFDVLSFV